MKKILILAAIILLLVIVTLVVYFAIQKPTEEKRLQTEKGVLLGYGSPWPSPSHIRVFGRNCPCEEGTTTNIECIRNSKWDESDCHIIGYEFNQEGAKGLLQEFRQSTAQIYRIDSPVTWWSIELEQGSYNWEVADWVVNNYVEYGQGEPVLMLGEPPWWTNGFVDPSDKELIQSYRNYVKAVVLRYRDKVKYYEIYNEPFSLWLSDLIKFKNKTDDAVAMLKIVTEEISRIVRENDPDGFLIAPTLSVFDVAYDKNSPERGVLEYIVENDLADFIGVHYGWFGTEWSTELSIYGASLVAPDFVSCTEFSGYNSPTGWEGNPSECYKSWRFIDETLDHQSDNTYYVLDKYNKEIPIWSTETHSGFALDTPKDYLMGLRTVAILAHQKVMGIHFTTFGISLPEILINSLSGTSPVYKLDAQLRGSDYPSVVYKLFNREDEDIMAIWSNDPSVKTVNFDLSINPGDFNEITVIKFDADEGNFIQTENLNEFPKSIQVKSMKQFYFISVTPADRNKTRFIWLSGVNFKEN